MNETRSSEEEEEEDGRPFNPPFRIKVAWCALFGCIFVVALLGNATVIYIIATVKTMRSKTNLFLLNLAIADLLTVLFNLLFNFYFMLSSHWPFGHIYCTICNFISYLTVTASVLTITATSMER